MRKNTLKLILGIVTIVMFAAVSAYAAMEAGVVEVPGKTLGDFERQYSHTKPMIAWSKFQEYRRLENAPRPTLSVSRMRTGGTFEEGMTWSKPLALMGEKPTIEKGEVFIPVADGSGSKPIVGYRAKG
ncbi:MAG TPA: hypothetical protein VD913_04375 [bacterium]|nr:hypothetical protein [bacterium]